MNNKWRGSSCILYTSAVLFLSLTSNEFSRGSRRSDRAKKKIDMRQSALEGSDSGSAHDDSGDDPVILLLHVKFHVLCIWRKRQRHFSRSNFFFATSVIPCGRNEREKEEQEEEGRGCHLAGKIFCRWCEKLTYKTQNAIIYLFFFFTESCYAWRKNLTR